MCTNVLGIPSALVRLETAIFTGVDPIAAVRWPEMLVGALHAGEDPEPGLTRWLWWLCQESSPGAELSADRDAAAGISKMYGRMSNAEQVELSEWSQPMRRAAEGGAWHAWHAGRYTVAGAALGVPAPDAPAAAARWIADTILHQPSEGPEEQEGESSRRCAAAWLKMGTQLVAFPLNSKHSVR